MNINLPENIRTLRKARAMTQEQLAEALGVSAQVISKWELGLSSPDLTLLLELADTFETSVDALLGYQLQSRGRAQALSRINAHIYAHDEPVDWDDVERILLKYPNDFEILYRAALLYTVRATPTQDHRLFTRALALFEDACRLIAQNTNPEISLTAIQTERAQILRAMGRKDEAVQLLKENNPCGVNNGGIGEILAQCGKGEEAIPYLSRAMLKSISLQMEIASGYMNAYMRLSRYREATDVLRWIESALRSIRRPETVCYADKILSGYIVARAYAHLLLGETTQARETLAQAKAEAQRFDAAPEYSARNVLFVTMEAATAYDDYGDTALDGIDRFVREQKDERFTALWTEIR